MDLHFYAHWSCQLALLAGLSMMYDRFLNTTWKWPYSEDLMVSLMYVLLLQLPSAQAIMLCISGLETICHLSMLLPSFKTIVHDTGIRRQRRQ